MGKKMYYNDQEAAEVLGISAEEFANYIRDDKIRVFQDGPHKMFRVDEIDAMAGGSGPSGEEEIELTEVADTGGEEVALTAADAGQEEIELPLAEQGAEKEASADAADEVSLAEADVDAGKAETKEDTVITAEGISIFDDEDLEIEAADPLAKTQIAPSLEDQISIEGVGSGSGLLDLTRESDDTSLGAEVLDHIDETEVSAELGPAPVPDVEAYEPQPVAAAVEPAATFVEQLDPRAGMFSGMIVGCAVVAMFLGSVSLASARGAVPGYLEWYKQSLPGLLIGAAVLVGVATLIGFFLGRAIAARQQAARDMKV